MYNLQRENNISLFNNIMKKQNLSFFYRKTSGGCHDYYYIDMDDTDPTRNGEFPIEFIKNWLVGKCQDGLIKITNQFLVRLSLKIHIFLVEEKGN